MTQPTVTRPLAEADFAYQFRLDPVRAPCMLPRHGVGERRVIASQRLQVVGKVTQRLLGEAGADVPGVQQPPVVIRYAEEERTDHVCSPAFTGLPAADHDLLRT